MITDRVLDDSPAAARAYAGETYYGLPAIKVADYGWLVTTYFYVGGLASASQFIATAIDLLGREQDRPAVRAGRAIALAGALASPPLLIADLQGPQRWYNMLRIYRPTSAMSIGSWALTIFGVLSGLAAVGQAAEDWLGLKAGRWLSRAAGLPAALAGGLVSLYTGTLLSATNVPAWASGSPFLSSLFASSAASTATAALTLATGNAPEQTRRRLTWVALASGAAELFLALLAGRGWRGQAGAPSHQPRLKAAWWVGVLGLGIAAPLAVHAAEVASGRDRRQASILAAVATLVGGYLLRLVFVLGGLPSAERPEDYFRATQKVRG